MLALGTSLTQGYNVAPGEDFVSLLQAELRAKGYAVTIQNAGVSGDTSAGGRARLDWLLTPEIDAVMVELGSNDALRGQNPDDTRANLRAILDTLKARGLPVLLAGMMAPRNLGPDYIAAFDPIYPELATEYGAILWPFFLDGVAAQPALNQPDGIHPNEAGTKVIVANGLPYAEALLKQAAAKTP